MSEMKPCPFCGVALEPWTHPDDMEEVMKMPPEDRDWRHPDNDCQMFGGYEFSAGSARGWNRREVSAREAKP